jgi:inosine-uridine nucleoside N-ribohydrolase
MGSGMYADSGGINGIDARREFNWWFDPEAVRIVMRAPWKKITITPVDISVKTKLGPEIRAAIAKADTPVARYLNEYSVESFMWDELSAAAMVDPSITILTTAQVTVRRFSGRQGQSFLLTKGARQYNSM